MIGDKYSFWPLTLNSVTSVHQTQIQQRISEVSDSIKKENIELETITKELDSKVKK
ncbi:conserved domain protein [Mycoplasma leachii PG50]|uniref:Conserved domain protein n=2 Tax=Mycoplasma TaxID=2093 RepID=E4PSW7_MYCLG